MDSASQIRKLSEELLVLAHKTDESYTRLCMAMDGMPATGQTDPVLAAVACIGRMREELAAADRRYADLVAVAGAAGVQADMPVEGLSPMARAARAAVSMLSTNRNDHRRYLHACGWGDMGGDVWSDPTSRDVRLVSPLALGVQRKRDIEPFKGMLSYAVTNATAEAA